VTDAGRVPPFSVTISRDPLTELFAERLRDGRIALGTRILRGEEWQAGELHLLDPSNYLDLTAWLSNLVGEAWEETVQQRQAEPLRTAYQLYGEGPGAIRQLAHDTIDEIPPSLLARALLLLANSVGPQARERLVERLNVTENRSEELELRRRLADENETFAYAVAAAALFDALARGILPEDM
jgi:hypothetical protein